MHDEQSLPDYIVGQSGINGTDLDLTHVPKGSDVMSLTLYATKNAMPRGVLVNGARVPYFKGTDRGHPTFEVQLLVAPQKTVEVQFQLLEPSAPGAPRVPVQPLLDNITPVVAVPQCTGNTAEPPA